MSFDFKTKRIRNHPTPIKVLRDKVKMNINPATKYHLLLAAGGIAVLLILLYLIFLVIGSLNFSSIIFSFGKQLQTDDKGQTNILLVGVGGEGHDGANLTDTIIVASIDYKNKLVPMLSIPRDLYVETKQTGRSRINYVYYAAMTQFGHGAAMNVVKETVSKITGIPIQYYIKINFQGFEKIVDSLGGVDVNVEKDIYDPEYPRGETIYYETFSIKAGPQHLDGKTALKYARSRKTTSDFDRAKRQQQILYAIKDKALSLNILTDPGKIQSLYNSVSESIETNLSLAEIIEMAKIAKDLGKESTLPMVINDDPTACGGLVYTPAREYFGNASVLLFAGNNYDYMQLFVNTAFSNPLAIASNDQIQVLNGTKVPGLAYEGMSMLSRFCLNVIYYSNAENRDLDESTIYYKAGPNGEEPLALSLVKTIMPNLKTVAGIPANYLQNEKRQNAVIVVELGKDYLSKRIKDPFNTLKYLTSPQKSTQETTETKQTKPQQ
jgi:LCP family protein required for cell wall assembly